VGRIARLLLAAAVAVPLVGSAAGPAAACACVPSGAKQILRSADAIIAGKVENEITLDASHTRSIVRVQGVYRGNPPATIYVDTDLGTGGGKSCALLYPVGSVVDPMVLQKLPDGNYTIEQCVIGSTPQLRALLGTARPPPLAGLSPSPDGTELPVPVATSTPISGMRWGAVALGLALGVVLIAAALRWSGRGAVEPVSPFDDLPGPSVDGAGPEEPASTDAPGPDASG
jgi:hypothetical protein